MPAGSGPQCVQVSNVVLAADTAEHILAVMPPGNWNNPSALGNLVGFSVVFTGAAAGTLTFRIRQGNALAGAQVGVNAPVVAANGAPATPSAEFLDQTAFGNAQQGGQYILTYQQSANSLGTVNNAVFELETGAPLA